MHATTNTWTEELAVRCTNRWRLNDEETDRCEHKFQLSVLFIRDQPWPIVEFLDLPARCPECGVMTKEQLENLIEEADSIRSFE